MNRKAESTTITIRVSRLQKADLQWRCQQCGIELSAWIRARLFEGPLPQPRRSPIPPINREAVAELNRIGINLNQLVRRANGGWFFLGADDRRVLASLQSLLAVTRSALQSPPEPNGDR